MMGKKTLKMVQQESEQLLKLIQQQQRLDHQPSRSQKIEQINEDLESTLKAEEEDDIFKVDSNKAVELKLIEKIQLLETQLALERLLLSDQRAANALQQKQV